MGKMEQENFEVHQVIKQAIITRASQTTRIAHC